MILVVDFDEERRTYLMDLVREDMGRSPIAARSAREMIEQIKKFTFDLILVNFDLPDINGKEIPFLDKLRSNFSALQLPIILIAASGNWDLVVRGLEHGCNDSINLPFNGPLVLAQIRNQLKLKTEFEATKAMLVSHSQPAKNDREAEIPVSENGDRAGAIPETDNEASAKDTKPLLETYETGEYPLPLLGKTETVVQSNADGTGFQAMPETISEVSGKTTKPFLDAYATDEYPVHPAISVNQETVVKGNPEDPGAEAVEPPDTPVDAYATDEYLVHPTVSVKEWIRFKGNSTQRECVEFLTNLARSLHFSHQKGVVHGEIPSDSVQIWPDGRVLVHEIGPGIVVGENTLNRSANRGMPDSPIYSSPEQLLSQNVTPQSDVYCFGILAYEVLTGRPPFYDLPLTLAVDRQIKNRPGSILKHRVDIDLALEKIVFRCLEKRPEDRFEGCEPLVATLEALQPPDKAPPGTKPTANKQDSPVSAENGGQPSASVLNKLEAFVKHVAGSQSGETELDSLEKVLEILQENETNLSQGVSFFKRRLANPTFLDAFFRHYLNPGEFPLLSQFLRLLDDGRLVLDILQFFQRESDDWKKEALGELAIICAGKDLMSLVIFGLELEDRDASLFLKSFGETVPNVSEPVFLKWSKHGGFHTQMELLKIIGTASRPDQEKYLILNSFANRSFHSEIRSLAKELLAEQSLAGS